MPGRSFSGGVALWLALSMATVRAGEVSGVSMPDAVSVAGRGLRLNGMGRRVETALFKAYVIGLYLEKPTKSARAAIATDEAKRVVLTMLRDVSREAFVEAVETGFTRNAGSSMPNIRARLDLLEHALPALKKGNVLDITYLPEVGTVIRGQGREMTIAGKDFSDALLAVWLGSKPVSEALKRQLLGG
jgi:hypothetical protein